MSRRAFWPLLPLLLPILFGFTAGESPGIVELAVDRVATAEGDGPFDLEVERREGTLGPVTVDYTVRAESAVDGVDFTSISGTVFFADGDSTPKVLTVPVIDDALREGDETFRVVLSNPGGGARLGPVSSTRVEIRDDDVPSPLLQNAGGIFELDNSYVGDPNIGDPLVAALAGGGFAALWWVHYRFDAMSILQERLYDREGREIARNFSRFGWTSGFHVAAQPGGGFTIVSSGEDAVTGQRFDPRGRPQAPEFELSGSPAAIAAGRSGGLLTLWTSRTTAGHRKLSVIAYGGRGQPLGPPQLVRPSPACGRTEPAIASDGLGRAVVAWMSPTCRKILVRRTDTLGRVVGETMNVTSAGASANLGRIAVAAAPGGRYVVVWEAGDGEGWGIFARLFGADDRPLGPAFQVNSHRIGDQVLPRAAMQEDGRFLVIWQTPGDLDGRRIRKLFGQYFGADARRLGGDFPVDSEEPYAEELDASLAVDAAGRYVAAWRRYSGDTINARRLTAP